VKISDRTHPQRAADLCAGALEFPELDVIRVCFDRIRRGHYLTTGKLLEVLRWYKRRHPIWFSWLEIGEPAPRPE
jgi:hypothetical protein